MRTLIDVPENQLKELKAICTAKRLSRAEAVRQAISVFIEQNRIGRETAFGSWRDQHVYLPGETEPLPQDGQTYQEKFRSEW